MSGANIKGQLGRDAGAVVTEVTLDGLGVENVACASGALDGEADGVERGFIREGDVAWSIDGSLSSA